MLCAQGLIGNVHTPQTTKNYEIPNQNTDQRCFYFEACTGHAQSFLPCMSYLTLTDAILKLEKLYTFIIDILEI